jgi:toxin ParE1/3/4
MPRLLFTQSAHSDLLEAWLFIAEDNPEAADRVLSRIEKEDRETLIKSVRSP